ncbi:3-phosphoserine/phosphohydroxythreonine transaminase [Paenibacillus harenae]|uniref:3-phosphoserine/phosphohydroxythreonine transaminase n=1 Tax=Paenibacillus harenae TaxID=306543 RepID=UPI002791A6D0|nr:3-phosphoserine/phosphohydroxythreonine transaminase [Paenibacillus harenae]MDQ0062833.1 phosphoserine aminotransferase [Paenibacillus harenae]
MRNYNFNPGPAALPLEVLEEAQRQFIAYGGGGMSIMEMSHRSPAVERMVEETGQLFKKLLGLPDAYRVLFMGGGASMQFGLIPMNFLKEGQTAHYILSGSFSDKAYSEARAVGNAVEAASGKDSKWRVLPDTASLLLGSNAAYVHMTTNNTIEGSQFKHIPDTNGVPLIGDMTSDIMSRKLDFSKFAMFYAGAQKNIGPAGVTVAAVHENLLADCSERIPTIMKYSTYADNDSLYNTPPVHSLYMTKLVLEWTERQGGIAAMEQSSKEKAAPLYGVIDASDGFYQGIIGQPYRSNMNVTWRMRDEALEKQLIAAAEERGIVGLAGHRSVGGLRASIYNAVPLEACEALADLMIEFQRVRG